MQYCYASSKSEVHPYKADMLQQAGMGECSIVCRPPATAPGRLLYNAQGGRIARDVPSVCDKQMSIPDRGLRHALLIRVRRSSRRGMSGGEY